MGLMRKDHVHISDSNFIKIIVCAIYQVRSRSNLVDVVRLSNQIMKNKCSFTNNGLRNSHVISLQLIFNVTVVEPATTTRDQKIDIGKYFSLSKYLKLLAFFFNTVDMFI